MPQAGPRSEPTPVKLVAGLLYPRSDLYLLEWSKAVMSDCFGEVERESDPFPFGYTDYYRDISAHLDRVFFSFAGLRDPGGLVSWKLSAIEMEAAGSKDGGGRSVNIDPGYLDGARIVLASTKDHAHRIYISDGIYAEVTLCRRKSAWERFYYTFPDFKSGVYDDFFESVRQDWRRDMRDVREAETRI